MSPFLRFQIHHQFHFDWQCSQLCLPFLILVFYIYYQIFKSKSLNSNDSFDFMIVNLKSIFLLSLFFILLYTAQFQQLQNLVGEKFSDQTSVIRLANQQKFSIPLTGRYISYNLSYYPQNTNDCTFKQPNVQYKKFAQTTKLFQQDDQIIGSLVLKRQEKIILADPYFNIVLYSIDQHKLLRPLSPKTSLLPSNTQTGKLLVNSLAMIATQQQDYIYYLSPNNSFVFSAKSFGTQIEKLNVSVPFIQKSIYYKNYIIILTASQGLYVYKLNKTVHSLQKVQTLKNQKNHQFIDMEIDFENQLIYVLTQNAVEIYLFDPSNFPNPANPKEFLILKKQDQINLFNYTRNHVNGSLQNNLHLNLEISVKENIQVFVLFRHIRQNIIAEFVYDPLSKIATFLRYFKFQMLIKQIHCIEDVILVVGNEIIGMLPYGIDPRLITQEFNGWIDLSDIEKVVVTEAPYFVGITKNSIQYGKLVFSKQIQLHCKFSEQSLTKSIIFEGNLTRCSKEQAKKYNQYCSYNKKFILQQMDIVTTSQVSSSVWVIMLICTVCIILGIFIMLIMHKKKQEQIKKLELYFEQRRKTQIPASSDRRGEHN